MCEQKMERKGYCKWRKAGRGLGTRLLFWPISFNINPAGADEAWKGRLVNSFGKALCIHPLDVILHVHVTYQLHGVRTDQLQLWLPLVIIAITNKYYCYHCWIPLSPVFASLLTWCLLGRLFHIMVALLWALLVKIWTYSLNWDHVRVRGDH